MSENVENINVNAVEEASAPQLAEDAAQSKTEKKGFKKLWANVCEGFRKFLVGLKRNPQNIALLVYVVALLEYTLNQTKISDTTADINLSWMGLCSFASLLVSILGFVCFFNCFPKRQKPNAIMLALFSVMSAVVIFCDVVYYSILSEGIAKRLSELKTAAEMGKFYSEHYYVFDVQSVLIAHIVLIGVTLVLTLCSPLIGKLLRKIKTSITVEDNGEMEAIERADD